ncbi:MAG: hypothetical protein LE169_04325 [Endomicrobium sp.]|nr:hypothetical protein [Endomicrobium sp.]
MRKKIKKELKAKNALKKKNELGKIDLWKEIKAEFKKEFDEKPDEEYKFDMWIKPITKAKFDRKCSELTLVVPNSYYVTSISDYFCDRMEAIAKQKFDMTISILLIVGDEIEEEPKRIEEDRTLFIKKEEPQLEKGTFNKSPYFKNHSDFNSFIRDVKEQKIPENTTELNPMPCKYGIDDVATFSLLDSIFFTYPNDKRKKAEVNFTLKLADRSRVKMELRRGQITPADEGRGQLTTTHAKIFLAIVHMWQEQGSRYVDEKGYFSAVNVPIRELAKRLGYRKFGGKIFSYLVKAIESLVSCPFCLSNQERFYSFSFFTSVSGDDDKGNYNRTVFRIMVSPFISRQLYDRRAFLRNSDCYRIKNPTAFKFLLCYDKEIIKGNTLKIGMHDIAEDLEMSSKMLLNVSSVLRAAFRELDGFELNENYKLKAKVIKEGKRYYALAYREPKPKEISSPAEELLVGRLGLQAIG